MVWNCKSFYSLNCKAVGGKKFSCKTFCGEILIIVPKYYTCIQMSEHNIEEKIEVLIELTRQLT